MRWVDVFDGMLFNLFFNNDFEVFLFVIFYSFWYFFCVGFWVILNLLFERICMFYEFIGYLCILYNVVVMWIMLDFVIIGIVEMVFKINYNMIFVFYGRELIWMLDIVCIVCRKCRMLSICVDLFCIIGFFFCRLNVLKDYFEVLDVKCIRFWILLWCWN